MSRYDVTGGTVLVIVFWGFSLAYKQLAVEYEGLMLLVCKWRQTFGGQQYRCILRETWIRLFFSRRRNFSTPVSKSLIAVARFPGTIRHVRNERNL